MWSLIGVCVSVARSVFLRACSDRVMRMEMTTTDKRQYRKDGWERCQHAEVMSERVTRSQIYIYILNCSVAIIKPNRSVLLHICRDQTYVCP